MRMFVPSLQDGRLVVHVFRGAHRKNHGQIIEPAQRIPRSSTTMAQWTSAHVPLSAVQHETLPKLLRLASAISRWYSPVSSHLVSHTVSHSQETNETKIKGRLLLSFDHVRLAR